MPPKPNSVLIAGFPHAGKSTYLAALWHLMYADEEARIKIAKLDGEQAYFQGIERKWLSWAEIGRTLPNQHDEVFAEGLQTLPVLIDGNAADIVLPDISGETFSVMWEMREVPSDVARHMKNSGGLVLFINPLLFKEPHRIEQELQVAGSTEAGSQLSPGPVESHDGNDAGMWQAKKAAPAAKLVELLQVFKEFAYKGVPLRVSIVISAWDAIMATSPRLSPSQWVEKRSALLASYLKENNTHLQSRVFGVSAQGCDYKNLAEEKKAMTEMRKRVIVQDGDVRSNEIALPVVWAIGA